MVAVILLLQLVYRLFDGPFVGLGQSPDIILHLHQHFLFRDTADTRKLWIHGDIRKVVQFAEDAELGEFGDARKEDKLEIGIGVFQRRVEVAHHVAEYGQLGILVHYIEQWGIIFVDKNNHLLASLLMGTLNKTLKSLVGFHLVGSALAIYRLIAGKFVA